MKTAEQYESEIADMRERFRRVVDEFNKGKDAYEQRIADLERSAASAREIARVAMTHTGTRAMRVEMFSTDTGIQIIVCDPAGDETETSMRLAKMLDAALWARIGIEFTGATPEPVGSTA